VTAYSSALKDGVFANRPIVRKPFQREDIQNIIRGLVPGTG
jgi:hypothetical protein